MLPRTLVRLGLCAAIAASTWLIPTPEGMSTQGWHVVALSAALGSRLDHEPERAGRYLVLTGAHANLAIWLPGGMLWWRVLGWW